MVPITGFTSLQTCPITMVTDCVVVTMSTYFSAFWSVFTKRTSWKTINKSNFNLSVDGWMDGWIDERTDGRTGRPTDRPTDRQTNGQTVYVCMYLDICKLINNKWSEECMLSLRMSYFGYRNSRYIHFYIRRNRRPFFCHS